MITEEQVNVTKCTCDMCSWEWVKKVDLPAQCPRCKSTRWNYLSKSNEDKKEKV